MEATHVAEGDPLLLDLGTGATVQGTLLSYIEYRIPALYHACQSHLGRLDAVQRFFLKEVGLSDSDALLSFNLAPLSSRRDMAMLGVIHRAVLGLGPKQLHQFFQVQIPQPQPSCTRRAARRHCKQLIEFRSVDQLCILGRSAFGLVAVYNLLPADVVALGSVQSFQAVLQGMLRSSASSGIDSWEHLFSPRQCMHRHPLHVYKWDARLLLCLTNSRWGRRL